MCGHTKIKIANDLYTGDVSVEKKPSAGTKGVEPKPRADSQAHQESTIPNLRCLQLQFVLCDCVSEHQFMNLLQKSSKIVQDY
jgi:hypothetical protein